MHNGAYRDSGMYTFTHCDIGHLRPRSPTLIASGWRLCHALLVGVGLVGFGLVLRPVVVGVILKGVGRRGVGSVVERK